MRPRPQVLLSAHRCGAGGDKELENTRVALDRALALGVEYVEFDVHRCADGELVLFHDDWITVEGEKTWLREVTFEQFAAYAPRAMRYDEVLEALDGRAHAHIDLKFSLGGRGPRRDRRRPARGRGARRGAGSSSPPSTTGQCGRSGSGPTLRGCRSWPGSRSAAGVRGLPLRAAVRIRLSELFPRLLPRLAAPT